MWLGLSVHEKKFNSFSEGTFSVFAEMVGPPVTKNFFRVQQSRLRLEPRVSFYITV